MSNNICNSICQQSYRMQVRYDVSCQKVCIWRQCPICADHLWKELQIADQFVNHFLISRWLVKGSGMTIWLTLMVVTDSLTIHAFSHYVMCKSFIFIMRIQLNIVQSFSSRFFMMVCKQNLRENLTKQLLPLRKLLDLPWINVVHKNKKWQECRRSGTFQSEIITRPSTLHTLRKC